MKNPKRNGVHANCLQLCKKHHFGIDRTDKLAPSPDDSKFLMKTLTQIKSNVAVPIKKKVMSDDALLCFSFFSSITIFIFYHLYFFLMLYFYQPPFMLLSTHPPLPNQYSPAFQVKENKERERMERRLLDELYKVFMDSDSFYYSMTYDLTNTVQRQGASGKSDLPLWKQVGRHHTNTHTNETPRTLSF